MFPGMSEKDRDAQNCSILPETKGPMHHAWLLLPLDEYIEKSPKALGLLAGLLSLFQHT